MVSGIKKLITAVKTLRKTPFLKTKLKNCKHKVEIDAADLFESPKLKRMENYRGFPDKPEPNAMTLTYPGYDAEEIKRAVAAWSTTINLKS